MIIEGLYGKSTDCTELSGEVEFTATGGCTGRMSGGTGTGKDNGAGIHAGRRRKHPAV